MAATSTVSSSRPRAKGSREMGLRLPRRRRFIHAQLGGTPTSRLGIRYDFEPDSRTYATVAVESLLPYWFEVEASLFLSDRGDFFGRLEGSYDLRLTQRLILQPRIELELAAQNVPEANIGSGLSSAELGLRLRYEIRKEFAPYIGVNFEKNFGTNR